MLGCGEAGGARIGCHMYHFERAPKDAQALTWEDLTLRGQSDHAGVLRLRTRGGGIVLACLGGHRRRCEDGSRGSGAWCHSRGTPAPPEGVSPAHTLTLAPGN